MTNLTPSVVINKNTQSTMIDFLSEQIYQKVYRNKKDSFNKDYIKENLTTLINKGISDRLSLMSQMRDSVQYDDSFSLNCMKDREIINNLKQDKENGNFFVDDKQIFSEKNLPVYDMLSTIPITEEIDLNHDKFKSCNLQQPNRLNPFREACKEVYPNSSWFDVVKGEAWLSYFANRSCEMSNENPNEIPNFNELQGFMNGLPMAINDDSGDMYKALETIVLINDQINLFTLYEQMNLDNNDNPNFQLKILETQDTDLIIPIKWITQYLPPELADKKISETIYGLAINIKNHLDKAGDNLDIQKYIETGLQTIRDLKMLYSTEEKRTETLSIETILKLPTLEEISTEINKYPVDFEKINSLSYFKALSYILSSLSNVYDDKEVEKIMLALKQKPIELSDIQNTDENEISALFSQLQKNIDFAKDNDKQQEADTETTSSLEDVRDFTIYALAYKIYTFTQQKDNNNSFDVLNQSLGENSTLPCIKNHFDSLTTNSLLFSKETITPVKNATTQLIKTISPSIHINWKSFWIQLKLFFGINDSDVKKFKQEKASLIAIKSLNTFFNKDSANSETEKPLTEVSY